MKKLLFVVAVLALVAPATFARDYMHMTVVNGVQTGSTYFNQTSTSVGLDQPNVNWEYNGADSERKAENWNWPAYYDWVDVCVIPVKMDIGIYVRVNNCKNLELDLKQVAIHTYKGQVTANVVTNAQILLNAYWTKTASFPMGSYGNSVSVSPSSIGPVLDSKGNCTGNGVNVVITLTLTSVDLACMPAGPNGNCVLVGTVTLQVKPNWSPCLCGGCGQGAIAG